jgi:hypothetical protein
VNVGAAAACAAAVDALESRAIMPSVAIPKPKQVFRDMSASP